MRTVVTEKQIKKAANQARSINEIGAICGYVELGSTTRKRFERILGPIYGEIASGKRNSIKKKDWTKC